MRDTTRSGKPTVITTQDSQKIDMVIVDCVPSITILLEVFVDIK